MSSILKVDTLQDTGANTILASDGSGNVTTNKTSRPAFCGYKASGTQNIGSVATTKITMTTELYDTDSAYDATNSKFTVPTGKAGYYYLQLKVRDDFQDGYTREAIIYKNGASLIRSRENNHTTTRHYTHVSGIVYLAEADYIEGYIYNGGTSTREIDGTSLLETSLMGYRIGD